MRKICGDMVTLNIRILVFIILAASGLQAENDRLNRLYENLKTNYSQVETYQAEFRQENFWQEMNLQKISWGRLFYDNNRLLLEYDEPLGQRLLLDSLGVLLYDPASERALYLEKMETELRPLAFLALYWDKSEKKITDLTDKSCDIHLNTAIGERIIVRTENDFIKELTYVDNTGNQVHYEFFNEQYNVVLPDEIFRVEIPSQVNIIDNRK
ncbi:MAG: outer membrane lipoprotein carrier protein LolA [Candidatus Cloacimonetes bacterium]|nr:outer membrane lipoprotein carrier protein LolA [Candidatus Cloacimonadota bacterium]